MLGTLIHMCKSFLDTITRMSNMQYFNVQHVALDYRLEEHDFDMALHDDDEVAMEGNA